jgi:release factor glutamine methyltransferase
LSAVDGAPSWRALLDEATARLGDASDARRIVEEATGWSAAEMVVHLDDQCTAITHARWTTMVERRAAGEPLQYVLGAWGFRTLDLLVDRRVLIPRPETEHVVTIALDALDDMGRTAPGVHRTAVDLGTGSGAIAISLAVERPKLDVWATDRSADALAVAQVNLAGAGRAAARVRLLEGDWYDALPIELAGTVDLIVANPPYIGASEDLPDEVRQWEPTGALVSGPTGLEAIEVVVAGARRWLRPTGALVVEIGAGQTDDARRLAERAGFREIAIRRDPAGRPRALRAAG